MFEKPKCCRNQAAHTPSILHFYFCTLFGQFFHKKVKFITSYSAAKLLLKNTSLHTSTTKLNFKFPAIIRAFLKIFLTLSCYFHVVFVSPVPSEIVILNAAQGSVATK